TIRGHTPCTAVSTAGQTVHRRRVRAARASSARRSGLALDERRRTDVQHGAGGDLTVDMTEKQLTGVLAHPEGITRQDRKSGGEGKKGQRGGERAEDDGTERV